MNPQELFGCDTQGMRALIAVALLVAIVSGCSGSTHTGGAPAPPRIAGVPRISPALLPTTAPSGSVARFPCPKHPVSTIDLESCTVRRVLVLNGRVNARIKIIWSRIRDAAGRRYFVRAEKASHTYVRNECTSRSRAWINPAHPHVYAGGTLAPVEYGLCTEELTARHLRELTETAAALAAH
jgi:hypothetical protein